MTTYNLHVTNYQKPKADMPGYFGFSWDYCKEPPKDGVIKTGQYWQGCRDAGIALMREDIVKGKMKTDYTRMLFKWGLRTAPKLNAEDRNTADAWVNRAVNVLHCLEKLGGWALTRVYKLETPDDTMAVYYFLSSRRWIKSSYLAYMYVLLVRMCHDKWWGKHKSFKDLKEAYYARAKGAQFSYDHGFIRQSFPYWEAIIRGYPQLFEKKKINHYWDYNRINSHTNNKGEGIDKLSRNNSEYRGLFDELKKLKTEFDKEAKKNERKTKSKGKGN